MTTKMHRLLRSLLALLIVLPLFGATDSGIDRRKVGCMLKTASLPMVPEGVRILAHEVSEDGEDFELELTFQGKYGEPKGWWSATPDWVGGEDADWEGCETKGDFNEDASCLELERGYIVVEGQEKITINLHGPIASLESCKPPSSDNRS